MGIEIYLHVFEACGDSLQWSFQQRFPRGLWVIENGVFQGRIKSSTALWGIREKGHEGRDHVFGESFSGGSFGGNSRQNGHIIDI